MNKVIDKPKGSVINLVFIAFIASAILVAGFSGNMKAVGDASFEAAKSSVTLAIGLVGIMALWLGLVRVLEAGGLMRTLARLVRPIMVRLFPDVPEDHPAMSAMVLNISANMLGLGNAATPFGIKAMIELNKLNKYPGVATNAMCMFLVINTSNVALLPLGAIGVRAAAGSSIPAAIFIPTLLATTVSTLVGIIVCWWLACRDRQHDQQLGQPEQSSNITKKTGGAPLSTDATEKDVDYSHLLIPAGSINLIMAYLLLGCFAIAFIFSVISASDITTFLGREFAAYWLMPGLMLGIISYGIARGVKIYEAVTEGAKQGFEIAIRIIPFLVAVLVAVGMFRASGAMNLLVKALNPFTSLVGMPADVLPLALVRPLSGSGAFGVMSAIVEQAPDSYSSFVASTMLGSTETTFYVLAVYFGAVGVTRVRHALLAGLVADFAGIVASSIFCRIFWVFFQ